MPLSESFFLLLAAAGVWFWLDCLKARESAVRAAQASCRDEGVQFLDETVVLRSMRPARDGDGRLCLRRIYGFEFSDTGDNRRQGSVALLGQEIEWLHVRPHLYVVPKATQEPEPPLQ